MTAALHDEDKDVNEGTARPPGQLGANQSIPVLLDEMLRASDPFRLATTMDSLEVLGWKPVEGRERALQAIARGNWKDATSIGLDDVPEALLIWAAQDRDDEVLFAVWDEFARRRAVPPLLETLQIRTRRGKPPNLVRRRAAEALGRMGEQAADALVGFLGFGREVAAAAASGLLRIGDPFGLAIAAFGEWQLSANTVERLRETLRASGPQGWEALIRSLDRDATRTWDVARALAFGGHDVVMAAVAEALLQTGEARCVAAAMSALARDADRGVLTEWHSRWNTPRTIGLLIRTGGPGAVDALRKALVRTTDGGWANVLARALADIGTTDAARALADVVQDPWWEHRQPATTAAGTDARVGVAMGAAVRALGSLGDPVAVGALAHRLTLDAATAPDYETKRDIAIMNNSNFAVAERMLREILQNKASEASTEDLQRVLSLKPLTYHLWDPASIDMTQGSSVTFDPQPLHEMAREGLRRREELGSPSGGRDEAVQKITSSKDQIAAAVAKRSLGVDLDKSGHPKPGALKKFVAATTDAAVAYIHQTFGLGEDQVAEAAKEEAASVSEQYTKDHPSDFPSNWYKDLEVVSSITRRLAEVASEAYVTALQRAGPEGS